jgi:hypothetical protein
MKTNHTSTIDLLKACITSNNVVTRSVYKEIIAKRLNCSHEFIQQTYLIGYGR